MSLFSDLRRIADALEKLVAIANERLLLAQIQESRMREAIDEMDRRRSA